MASNKERSKTLFVRFLVFLGLLIIGVSAATGETLPTVVIDSCDTGITDAKGGDCLSISQRVSECAATAANRGYFVNCITSLANNLEQKGVIKTIDKGTFIGCAATASYAFIAKDPLLPKPFRFAFQTANDELGGALRSVYTAYITAPITGDEVAEINERRNAAVAYLRQHPDEAAERLVNEAACIGPTDVYQLQTLFHLLGWFDSEAGVAFMHEYSVRPLPTPGGTEESEMVREFALAVRSHAVQEMGRLRYQGSERAKLRLLDLVENADPKLRRLAVKTYYDSATQRWRAKREMEPRVPVETRYILHEIY